MTKKTIKSRKAISPILATLLLVVIAVAAIVVTYAWIMTYMNNANHQAGVILFMANVNFYNDSGTPKIAIDIGDSGTQGTNIALLYVGTSETNMQNQTFTPAQPPVTQWRICNDHDKLQLDTRHDILFQSAGPSRSDPRTRFSTSTSQPKKKHDNLSFLSDLKNRPHSPKSRQKEI